MTALAQELDCRSDADLPSTAPRLTRRLALPRPHGKPNASLVIKLAIGAISPLICLLAILGGIGSFATVRHLAVPWFGSSAWIVPIGIDVGILALLAWDLLAEYLGFPWPVFRWTAWAFIAATVYLNIAAAHGNPVASVMHAAMPALFVIVTEGIRHLVRQWTGLAAGTRIEHVPTTRWLLTPCSSFQLARRMVLWQVTSYRYALELEHQRLQAVARLQEDYGRYTWRWKAPLRDRLALRLAWAETATDSDSEESLEAMAALEAVEAEAATESAAAGRTAAPTDTLLAHLPRWCLVEPPEPVSQINDRDRALIVAARAILEDAERQGTPLSQATLAKRLRADGHRVANDRLNWLFLTASAGLRRSSAAGPQEDSDDRD